MQPSSQARQSREDRSRVLVGTIVLGFGLVVLGLVRLQVAQHEQYVELAKGNHGRVGSVRPPRGPNADQNGRLLADSAPSFGVIFRPFPVESVSLARRVLTPTWYRRVSGLIHADTAEVRKLVTAANARGQS